MSAARKSLLPARDILADWFVREVKRCAEIGMPLGCCGEWPECSHVIEWTEKRDSRCFACRLDLPQPCRCPPKADA